MTDRNEEDGQLRAQLLAAVRGVCSPRLQDRAEDITQVAVMAVLRIRERRETDDPLPASYLRKVAYTTMIDEIRRQRKERYDRSLDDEDSDIQPPSDEADPEQRLAGREASKAIRECVERLPQARREAVTLYLLELPVPEIAVSQGWSRKRASNLVFRGRAAVRRCLEEKGIEP